MRDLSLIFTAFAFKRIISKIRDGNQATEVADVYPVRIGHFEQTFSQKLGSSVTNLTVSLHLSKTQTSISIIKKNISNVSLKSLSHFTSINAVTPKKRNNCIKIVLYGLNTSPNNASTATIGAYLRYAVIQFFPPFVIP